MKRLNDLSATAASILLAAVLFLGCTDARVQPGSATLNNNDDRLTLTGKVCTKPASASDFPVKVVLMIDQSGSMCLSDPPGAQAATGLCEIAASLTPGVTTPARVRALKKILQQFSTKPNVQVAILPFETNVLSSLQIPPPGTSPGFVKPGTVTDNYLAGLQDSLGKGTDYQGVLSAAYQLVATDIRLVSANTPDQLPRTKYVVVFLTDGVPYPRCAANGTLPASSYASPAHPELIYADDNFDFCTLTDPNARKNEFPGPSDDNKSYLPGTDRNQNYQIFSWVDQLIQLKTQYNVGDVRLDTVLLFNQQAVNLLQAQLGAQIFDVYGVYPGIDPSQYAAATHGIASWLLKQMAARGNGVYQEFLDFQGLAVLDLGALDYTSLAAKNVAKSLVVQSLRSNPSEKVRIVDSDGDGQDDTQDNQFVLKTSPYNPDSDGDCFDDNFEAMHRDMGFDPKIPDLRGCHTPGCLCTDTDGDGLSNQAEIFLKTNPGLFDSDGDGIPDGLEVRYGLNPLVPDARQIDTDGDGTTDYEEIKADTHPLHPDKTFAQTYGYQYQLTSSDQPDGSVCYDFTVANLQLVSPPAHAGTLPGYNLFKVYFGQAPESGVITDYGQWKTACAWAEYEPPLRNPVGPQLLLKDSDFGVPYGMIRDADYLTQCVGIHP